MNYKYPNPPEHYLEDNIPPNWNIIKKANVYNNFGINEEFNYKEIINPDYLRDNNYPINIKLTNNIKNDLNEMINFLKEKTKMYLSSLVNKSENIKENKLKMISILKYFFYYLKVLKAKLKSKHDLIEIYKNDIENIKTNNNNIKNIIKDKKKDLIDLLNS